MKKNDWLIILATGVYSFLFYQQTAGVNFFLFNVILIGFLLVRDRTVLAQPAWFAAAFGSVISSFFVFWWGTWLPLLANICSLAMLSAFSFTPASSLLVAVANSSFSFFVSIPVSFLHLFSSGKNENREQTWVAKIPLLIIPVVITLIFFFLYRAANPIFEKFTDEIDLDFISVEWIAFTLIGFIIMFAFFRHQVIHWLTQTDNDASDQLSYISPEQHSAAQPLLSVANEVFTGAVLFALLNILLLSVNALDFYFMWVIQKMPEGITVAQYLHDGTNTLIVSIIFAIAVILFVFRGYLNFFENNKWLKLLAYGWIFQNAFLIITTAQRNWWIIESSGLTRRRIGVYVYLLLCLIGLATTLLKVAQQKGNWFLFRKNAWAFYSVFIVSCFINWDNLIVRFNHKHYKALDFKYIDRRYQTGLSHTCLASLFEYYKEEMKEQKPVQKIFTPPVVQDMYRQYYDLKNETDSASWKSYCVSKQKNVKAVTEMMAKEEVDSLPKGGLAPAGLPED